MSNPKVLVFTDFDGTVSTADTGNVIVDRFMGPERRKALDTQVLDGVTSYRDAVREQWKSVKASLEHAMDLLSAVEIDPDFPEFHSYCIQHKIPVTVVSSGLRPIVEAFMKDYSESEHGGLFDIVANDISIDADAGWDIIYRDETPHGHDKSLTLRTITERYLSADTAQRPVVVFVGDGISDISAAREADVIFAKSGKDLETWCQRENVPFIAWDRFGIVLAHLKQIVAAQRA
ncbi:HAD-like domain-containing protein [Polychytrium aggregatum]|uniref:HAD-like domain-containing protein n=1 Tax=Polychytrium aggregatum TaxID=110093 RepID=UPI0022FF3881|nr:HAD-like domain-containing protein [Polychytrium aggregatum]KAI9203468.1 HAD-like domain-containing protein [Polychytrium aggregatum]